MSKRADLFAGIARAVAELARDEIVRIAIDGVDGAGKTTFANELAAVMVDSGRPVIRASVDGFHNPRAIRYAKGHQSPIGFFEDSYNYTLLKRHLLDPLSPGGHRRYCIAAFDHVTDEPVDLIEREAFSNSILLLDGIFLHRPELRPYWKASIFLRVDFPVSVSRNAVRDGTSQDHTDGFNRRYVEGQRLYLSQCAPENHATIIVDNNNLAAPVNVEKRV